MLCAGCHLCTALHGAVQLPAEHPCCAAWTGRAAGKLVLGQPPAQLRVKGYIWQRPWYQGGPPAPASHSESLTGAPQVVIALLAHGADPSRADRDGNSPLHIAAAAGNLEVVRAFRVQARSGIGPALDPTVPNGGGSTARKIAEVSGWRSVMHELEAWERKLAGGGASTGPSSPMAQPPPAAAAAAGAAAAAKLRLPLMASPPTPSPSKQAAQPGVDTHRSITTSGGGTPQAPEGPGSTETAMHTPASTPPSDGVGSAGGTSEGASPGEEPSQSSLEATAAGWAGSGTGGSPGAEASVTTPEQPPGVGWEESVGSPKDESTSTPLVGAAALAACAAGTAVRAGEERASPASDASPQEGGGAAAAAGGRAGSLQRERAPSGTPGALTTRDSSFLTAASSPGASPRSFPRLEGSFATALSDLTLGSGTPARDVSPDSVMGAGEAAGAGSDATAQPALTTEASFRSALSRGASFSSNGADMV
jgi:hypothetical protein